MRKLILILLLFTGFSAIGQKRKPIFLINGRTNVIRDTLHSGEPPRKMVLIEPNMFDEPTTDTIRVIMLVCDTSEHMVFGFRGGDTATFGLHNSQCTWQFGYAINPVDCGFFTKYEYLDDDKKPLSKNMYIWIANEIKNNTWAYNNSDPFFRFESNGEALYQGNRPWKEPGDDIVDTAFGIIIGGDTPIPDSLRTGYSAGIAVFDTDTLNTRDFYENKIEDHKHYDGLIYLSDLCKDCRRKVKAMKYKSMRSNLKSVRKPKNKKQ